MDYKILSLTIIGLVLVLSESYSAGYIIPGTFMRRNRTKPPSQRSLQPVLYSNGTVVVDKAIRVFYQTAEPVFETERKLPVLFLHAAAFSSQTWKDLGTLQFLAAHGFNPIAIDLPGYGRTGEHYYGDKNKFLLDLMAELGIERPVLVSPSMSGLYSIPFILKHSDKLRGYVAIAPTNYGDYDTIKEDLSRLHLPTLAIYGSWDSYGRRMSRLIANIPGSLLKYIPFGSHPAYLDDPVLWHKMLKDFLDDLYEKDQKMLANEEESV